ncbi:hypothetical protein EDB92DRAFT_1871486 [Lactarius akahatsu]|uniref:Uncharacterized protein n=1 Tax=Lactarius akahatsu TaxID=416441 RepID=A0AAD4QCE2_9AGAM|nr:hypothetical protein EDB92DRAFT_1871486 [Lactarius akahatsu]
MELLVPHDPQPDEHMFSLIVNHESSMAGYSPKDVKVFEGIDPDHGCTWNYLERHPNHFPLPSTVEQEAKDALAWFYLGTSFFPPLGQRQVLTLSQTNLKNGSRSTVPFSKHECEDLLRVISRISSDSRDCSPGRTSFFSWLLKVVWSSRVSEQYGQQTYTQWNDHYVERIPSGPLPSAPFPEYIQVPLTFLYLEHIKVVSQYHGRLATVQDIWDKYTRQIVKEYQDFLLIATVLLSATVGLLAVPDIQSISRAAGIASVFSSLGSMITGVFCLWRHQTNVKQSQSFTYLHNAHQGILGLHGHAMVLSLPPVLLVWGIIAFAVGFIAYTAQGLMGPSDTGKWDAALVALGISLLMLILVGLGLYAFASMWKNKRDKS